jgi:hypothetical protein
VDLRRAGGLGQEGEAVAGRREARVGEADPIAHEAPRFSAADVDPHELRPEAVLGLVHAGDEDDDGLAVRSDLGLGEPDDAGEVLEAEASRLGGERKGTGEPRGRERRGHGQGNGGPERAHEPRRT